MAAEWQTVKVQKVRPSSKDKILGLRWPQLWLFMGKGVPSHEWQHKTIWTEEKGRWGDCGSKQLHPSPTIRWSYYLFLLSCFVWVVGELPSPGTFARKHPQCSLTPGDFVSMSEGHKLREKAKLFKMLAGIFRGLGEGQARRETAGKAEKFGGGNKRNVWWRV